MGERRPTAPKAFLRPFQSRSRSARRAPRALRAHDAARQTSATSSACCSHRFAQAVHFEQQHGGAIDRKSGVHVCFDRAYGPAVEHLAGGGCDAARGDVHDGFGGVVHCVENRQQRFHRFRKARKLHGDFRDQRERAFGTDEKAGEIVTRRIERGAAQANRVRRWAAPLRARGRDWW